MEPVRATRSLLKRLPLYLDYLRSLPREESNVSAPVIAAALGLGSVQVRKDLAKVSGEGRCRTGRCREQLIRDIEGYLEQSRSAASILVGTHALPDDWNRQSDVHVMACFDLDPDRNREDLGTPVYSINRLETFCKYYDVSIGIIAVSTEEAQAVCDGLIACGVRSIWNYSPVYLSVPQGVCLKCKYPRHRMGLPEHRRETA